MQPGPLGALDEQILAEWYHKVYPSQLLPQAVLTAYRQHRDAAVALVADNIFTIDPEYNRALKVAYVRTGCPSVQNMVYEENKKITLSTLWIGLLAALGITFIKLGWQILRRELISVRDFPIIIFMALGVTGVFHAIHRAYYYFRAKRMEHPNKTHAPAMTLAGFPNFNVMELQPFPRLSFRGPDSVVLEAVGRQEQMNPVVVRASTGLG